MASCVPPSPCAGLSAQAEARERKHLDQVPHWPPVHQVGSEWHGGIVVAVWTCSAKSEKVSFKSWDWMENGRGSVCREKKEDPGTPWRSSGWGIGQEGGGKGTGVGLGPGSGHRSESACCVI